jgi:hypothetical protein
MSLDLDAIEARANDATEGPWSHYGDLGHEVFQSVTDAEEAPTVAFDIGRVADAAFIAHTRTDVPALLAIVREQQAALDDLMYVANHKAADTEVGRWWAEVIRGQIIKHLGAEAAAKMGLAK